MAINSLDILNLSHSLKDICEVNCKTPECLNQTLQVLLEYNLIQANLEFSRQFACSDTPVHRRLRRCPFRLLPRNSGWSRMLRKSMPSGGKRRYV